MRYAKGQKVYVLRDEDYPETGGPVAAGTECVILDVSGSQYLCETIAPDEPSVFWSVDEHVCSHTYLLLRLIDCRRQLDEAGY